MRELIGQFILEKQYKNKPSFNSSATVKKVAKPKMESKTTYVNDMDFKAPKLEDVQEINLDDFDMDMNMGSKY